MKTPKEKDTTLTPMHIIEALGPFDLDPCAFEGRNTAGTLVVWPCNGLLSEWFGRVWCNPPYSDPSPWMDKMALHNDGIALVLASTDTKWFQKAASTASAICFPLGRPSFLRVDMAPVKLMRASAFIAWGEDCADRLQQYAQDSLFVKLR